MGRLLPETLHDELSSHDIDKSLQVHLILCWLEARRFGPASEISSWDWEGHVAQGLKYSTFPLRLPVSDRVQAGAISEREGISLNHFIAMAVAERNARMEVMAQRHTISVGAD